MEDQDRSIEDLYKKIERLVQQQQFLFAEIQKIQKNQVAATTPQVAAPEAVKVVEPKTIVTAVPVKEIIEPEVSKDVIVTTPDIKVKETVTEPISPPPVQVAFPPTSKTPPSPRPKVKTPIEDFIGTNLLNKIGIAVLVIGIGFGTKYAIDHDMLSPLTRIILGYLSGIALIGFAIKLKKDYLNFSAVLLSGGMAVLYFVTYAAYDLYELIPQTMAFVLMVLFTAFTAFAAVQYNLQIIAVIGLVGAYAVPFLLSDGSGRVVILFVYISIINTGIIILAFKKYWKQLYYLAFIFTWLIFGAWFSFEYNASEHFWISLIFASVFFITFYSTFLSYKLIRKEPLSRWDITFMMLNSFVYFGYGYATLDSGIDTQQYLGLFTLFTAVIHFIASVVIYKQQGQHKDTFYFIAGLVLVFITLAVPIQLEGNWVTLVWASEAALLFWIGRSKTYPVYEKLSYALILLAFFSLVQDWDTFYRSNYYNVEIKDTLIRLFLNIQFFTSLWVAAMFALIYKLNEARQYTSPLKPESLQANTFKYCLASLLGITVYIAFFKEVQTYWSQRYAESAISMHGADGEYTLYDSDLLHYQTVWLINYSAIFAMVISFITLRFIKDKTTIFACVVINVAVVTAFLTAGLYELSELRTSFLDQTNAQYYFRGNYHIIIRYIAMIFVVPLIVINYWFVNKTAYFNDNLQKAERILFHLTGLTLLSSELVHWLDMVRVENSFKLGLSILWGAYALFLIIWGLMKNQKHIRILAIVLFGITLIKLFGYDMADMSTIAKTVVMMILGVLLLTASFFYNKFKRSNENQ